MPHEFSSRVTIARDVMFSIVGDEAMILNPKTELYLGLDPIGTDMWTVLTGSSSIQDAYDSLLAQYDVKPERLRQDLNELLDQLIEQGLIEIALGENVAVANP